VSRKVAKFRAIFSKSGYSVETHDTQIYQYQAKVSGNGFCCWVSDYMGDGGWDEILDRFVDGDWIIEGELECGGEGEDFEMWATDYSIEKCPKNIIKSLGKFEIDEIARNTEFFVEGNKGGDTFSIIDNGDGTVRLKVGHSCVYTVDHQVPVEMLTATLNPERMTESIKGWSEELQKDLLSKLKCLKGRV
jgi:hypothetical protein